MTIINTSTQGSNTGEYSLTAETLCLLQNGDAGDMLDSEIQSISDWASSLFPMGCSFGDMSDISELKIDDVFNLLSDCYTVTITASEDF